MRIDRFGAVYSTAYTFPLNLMDDDWSITRPGAFDRVAGRPGVYDYWGDTKSQTEPFTLRKSFLVTSASGYVGVETAVEALRAATISASAETKLWLLRRDNTTRWAWAKCTSVNVSENYQGYSGVRATVEFFCREGVWYAS